MRFWSWPYSLGDDVEGSHWLLVPELRIWRLLWYAVIAPNLLFMFPFLCYMHMFWSIQDACWCSQAGESEGAFGVLVKVALLALFLRYVEALEADCISRVWLRVDLCAVTWQSASESAAQLMYSQIFLSFQTHLPMIPGQLATPLADWLCVGESIDSSYGLAETQCGGALVPSKSTRHTRRNLDTLVEL